MSHPAIKVTGLSKRYVIEHESRHDSLRDTLHHAARKLWRRWRWGTSFAREEFWALRDVSFSVEPGQVLGIIGRNGAGKSTLLKILSRITEATKGKVTLRGRVASLLEVGTGFHPDLTGRENIYLNGAILGMGRAEIRRKFDEIVAFAEIARFLDTPVKRYSSGMYVRLAFAVAAHLEPEILIVDEVLAVGDLAFQRKCLGKMQDVTRDRSRTVLFVSHNIAAVRQLCTRALLLHQGRLAAQGTTATVLEQYQQGFGATAVFAIPPPSPDLLTRAFATSVTIESLDGRAVSSVPIGAPWQIRVGIRAISRQREFVIGVGLKGADGTVVQTAWQPPRDMAPGDFEAVFVQDQVALEAGTYSVLVGLAEGGRALQQFDAARLDVTADNAVGYFPMTSGAGVVLNSMRTQFRPI